MASDKLFQVQGGYQNYAWGKVGSASAVAQFAASSDASMKIVETDPYAELWMGTHPKVPSLNMSNGKTLRDLITASPEHYLGSSIIKKFGSSVELPFLFKVLSIEKVLSIQAHPDKALAAQLHAADPKNYPDDNHKPEMAIAVTEFEGFCGFKPLKEIATELQKIPEFLAVVGEAAANDFINNIKPEAQEGSQDDIQNRKLLQKVFEKVMTTSDEVIGSEAAKLVQRTFDEPEIFGSKLVNLIHRLNKQFPNDIGLFCGALMLNYVELNPGEAVFLKAKDPHAYISGDIIECMAASDNVVRAGFTPKFKDVKNLVEMLTYSYDPVEDQKMAPQSFAKSSGEGKSVLYDPPIEEFSVLQTVLPKSGEVRSFKGFDGPSIVIVTNGAGSISLKGENVELTAGCGNVFFIAPGAEVDFKSTENHFVSYRAFVEA
ncbi:mannose-6-phosphate isomerase [Saccharomycopsis crataegensis]|uniref:Mannose-6-phosphate isomerase n=1 Tax=Saccharomycopsis crataegensis TaxID=43959 RepID=A0AAV5QE56_9ASCO|nr:mannose-6-phosphate isomerase [Saccharomycopsis crataegensis]